MQNLNFDLQRSQEENDALHKKASNMQFELDESRKQFQVKDE